MGQTLLKNEHVFYEFRALIDGFLADHRVTPQTLRNWVLVQTYPKRQSKFDPKLVEEVCKKVQSGRKLKDVAKEHGLTIRSVHFIVYGIKGKKPKYSAYHDDILLLHSKGKSVKSIADKLGVSYSLVDNTIRRKDVLEKRKEFKKQIDKAVRILNKGYTLKTVSEKTGIPYSQLLNNIYKDYRKNEAGQYVQK